MGSIVAVPIPVIYSRGPIRHAPGIINQFHLLLTMYAVNNNCIKVTGFWLIKLKNNVISLWNSFMHKCDLKCAPPAAKTNNTRISC